MATKAIRIVARINAQPDKIAEVGSLLLGLVEPTRGEKGCISYQLLQNTSDSADFCFIEEWASDSAFDAHLASPHLQAALSKAQSLLDSEPEIRRYTLLA